MDAVSEYKKRRQARLDASFVRKYRERRDARLSARYDDDEENNVGKTGGHGNTKIPFGLCQREGIQIGKDWSPKDAWDALAGKGYSAGDVYRELKETGKVAKKSAPVVKFGKEHAAAIKEYKDKKKEADRLKKDLSDIRSEWSTIKYGRLSRAESAVALASRDVTAAEQKNKLIGGRSLEELEKEKNELEQEYDLYAKMNERLHDRPTRGTPEREEWDSWINSLGGREAVEELLDKELISEDGVWKKLHDASNAVKYYNLNGPDGGLAVAREKFQKANENYESTAKALKDNEERTKELAAQRDKTVGDMYRAHKAYCDAVKVKYPTYNDCKTTKEVAERMDAENYFDPKAYSDPTTGEVVAEISTPVKLGRLSVESAREVAEDIDGFFKQVPEMKGKLQSVHVHGLRTHRRYGQSSYSDGVELNEYWYGNPAEYKRSYESDVKSGWHPEGTSYRSVLAHEYTHQIDDFFTHMFKDKMVSGTNFSDIVMKKCCDRLGMTEAECKEGVSKYARKKYSYGANKEFLAEAYAEYLTSSKPRKVAAEVGSIVSEYMKRMEWIG